MSDLYRDFIDQKADQIINSLGGTITPAPANAELYRDFLDRKFDDVINAIGNVKVKTFTYTGDGRLKSTITFPSKPKVIFIKCGEYPVDATTERYNAIASFVYGSKFTYMMEFMNTSSLSTAPISRGIFVTYEGDNIVHLKGLTPNQCCNQSNIEYTVCYI